jgi:acetyl-CoA synthetase
MTMEETVVPVSSQWAKNAFINAQRYRQWYLESTENPDVFWAKQAEAFVWKQKWTRVKNTRFDIPVSIKWFEGGKLNITENCLDRHLALRSEQTAYIWEGDSESESKRITYRELHEQVCRLSNVLKSHGVVKGDRVTIYLPMIPEAAVAMLACARIGAVHSVVFGGFSADALAGRIADCNSKLVITADEGLRGGKKVPLKANVDDALKHMGKEGQAVHRVIVVKRTGGPVAWDGKRDVWYHDEVAKVSPACAAESMDAEDPLYILYTSGSTGKPKGVLHTTAGYMVWASVTHKYTFDYHAPTPATGEGGDIFWCTADIGWVTGHTYAVYGPLLNAATTLMYEGIPTYPDSSRFWQVIDKHKVTIFHTAPTAIRALMREGDDPVTKTSRKSLRLIGSVGEPINPEAWMWYWRVVGEKRCPIVDTWWQTETGGNMIAPFPGATDLKPGSATLPFFGVRPVILNQHAVVQEGVCEGLLCISDSWPGQARTIYGDHERFEQTYFSQMPGYYFTGDGAKRDADGYYWITVRVDDVLNVSGHRLGTAEIESALVAHQHVAEAAVVGFPHDLKGQGIYAYVTLNVGKEGDEALHRELIGWVRSRISPIATPDHIHFTPALPKTRSGKIMRRILRKIAEGDLSTLGDTSTLTNPEIVDILIRDKKQ